MKNSFRFYGTREEYTELLKSILPYSTEIRNAISEELDLSRVLGTVEMKGEMSGHPDDVIVVKIPPPFKVAISWYRSTGTVLLQGHPSRVDKIMKTYKEEILPTASSLQLLPPDLPQQAAERPYSLAVNQSPKPEGVSVIKDLNRRTKWQYNMLITPMHFRSDQTDAEEVCDVQGKEGWELVSIVLIGSNLTWMFKRPIQ